MNLLKKFEINLDNNSYIHKYISFASFVSMLKDAIDKNREGVALRCYDAQTMNDPNEGNTGKVKKRDSSSNKDMEFLFISSFTFNEDSLFEWRTYADSGKGVCISTKIKNLKFSDVKLYRVKYLNSNEFEKERQLPLQVKYLFKNNAHSKENECRLLFHNKKSNPFTNVKIDEKDIEHARLYIEIPDFFLHKGDYITLGPAVKFDEVFKGTDIKKKIILYYLHKLGKLNDIQIKESGIEIRF